MKPIQLVDLRSQYHEIKEEVDQAILEIMDNSAFIGGSHVKGLAKELEDYLDVKHVIPCANGTDALQIALMAINAKPGDEILTPSFTYIATCEVIALLGLTPVFVDVDPDTFTIDPIDLRKKITSKSTAIVPVHLYGQCANMDEICAIAKEHGLKIIEDTAQAIGAKYTGAHFTKSAGGIGDIGTTSFFPSKNLGCYGDGGAIFTNDDDLADYIRKIANHGQSKRYYHDIIGVNSRLDNMQAAVLRIKLRKLDEYARRRQAVAAHYKERFAHLAEISTPVVAAWSTHVYHQYTMKLHGVDREGLQAALTEQGIPSNIYYPVPAHKQKGYDHYYDSSKDKLEITDILSAEVLSLPIHTEMEMDQLEHITNTILSYIKK
ncbi:MAG TPA: transcriptional regulator [Flavobacteriales bacterium]|jgi:UDP-2-acetamido-2-deoxy-ribo-hexuluronate aminotransferase|nr:DegT/DnrJ/EryC1/StrS family aminotransferase [Flavobacteriales bacterium]MDB9701730.1 DegT/DnrJ/EryC1/StrS family aminotransferase [Salibacteraceae bacterium]HAW19885.1 transcriptional regulator [Flavobacteriales bacterium]